MADHGHEQDQPPRPNSEPWPEERGSDSGRRSGSGPWPEGRGSDSGRRSGSGPWPEGRGGDSGRRDLAAAVTGAVPARSALTLRLILAAFGLLVCGAAAVLFALLEMPRPLVFLAAAFAVVAAVDLIVIARRKLHGEPG